MSVFVESLARLFSIGRITKEKLNSLVVDGKLTAEEYKYITGEDYIVV